MGVELNLPIVIEVIEVESRIDELMPTLREMIPEGLLTLENVRALRLRKGDG
jgi:PII-like signaling protein